MSVPSFRGLSSLSAAGTNLYIEASLRFTLSLMALPSPMPRESVSLFRNAASSSVKYVICARSGVFEDGTSRYVFPSVPVFMTANPACLNVSR